MLFDAFELRGVRLRNRLCAAPLASSSGDGLGLPTERSFEVYGKIAASGVALVNVEHCAVNPSGRVRPEQFLADSDRAAAAHAKIAALIREGGKTAVAQISHGGANISSAGVFEMEGFRCLSPSGVKVGKVWDKLRREPEKLSLPEIKKIVEDFAASAERMVRLGGYDGVLILAAQVGRFYPTPVAWRNGGRIYENLHTFGYGGLDGSCERRAGRLYKAAVCLWQGHAGRRRRRRRKGRH